ncbi:lanosterol 14-alpha demethylase-like [Oscarella lobularis]|uniref:lanosterol 14-alpha demethylase-like n=1 Tax=Oscarella lobularis TaxID=121494 RepID=UPI0033142104
MSAAVESSYRLLPASLETLMLPVIVLSLTCIYLSRKLGLMDKRQPNAPPTVPSPIPFIGNALAFGRSPIQFLLEAERKYGSIFTFTIFGQKLTYLVGSKASSHFFNAKNDDLNAEEVYGPIMTPVFGEGVCYDVPHAIFLEQKKMLKTGLTIAKFRKYVPVIEEETEMYFEKHWGESGQKDLFAALSEVIIMTASKCLQGSEIRSMMYEGVADLYHDLDAGLTPAAWLLPGWLPLPSFRKRDRAHAKLKEIFRSVIAKRRERLENEKELDDDILTYLMTTQYRDGRCVTDNEIAGLLIGLLMAGQHTSSTTSSWLGFYIAQDKEYQDKCFAEQLDIGGPRMRPLEYDQLKDMTWLEVCLKETLRLRPPLMTLMRLAKTPLAVDDYVIPAGHQVCVSPPTNHQLESEWSDSQLFNPKRFLSDEKKPSGEDKFSYVPFGAGRHRCIGEFFAYVQIKTIWSVLLRKYEFELVNGHFPEIDFETMIHTPKNPFVRYKTRGDVANVD